MAVSTPSWMALASTNVVESPSSAVKLSTSTTTQRNIPFLVVCTVDGNIEVVNAQTGNMVEVFESGGPLVGPSQFLDDEKSRRIVPGLDGRLYVSNRNRNSEGIGLDDGDVLQPLELTVVEVLQNPVKTCNTQDECGIVTATKSTTLFALNAATGHLVWQQSPNGTTIISDPHPSINPSKTTTVLLQREDVIVQQLSTESGKSVWNVTLGTLQALEFGDGGDYLPGTILLQDYEFPLPSLRFGLDGTSVSAVAPPSPSAFSKPSAPIGGAMWTQKFDSVVASVFGLQGNSWKPLNVLEEDMDENVPHHRPGSHRPLLGQEQQKPHSVLFGPGGALELYRPPILQDLFTKHSYNVDRLINGLFRPFRSSSRSEEEGGKRLSDFPYSTFTDQMLNPHKETLARLELHHDFFLHPNQLALPSPESASFFQRKQEEARQRLEKEQRNNRGGLFLTWQVLAAIILSILGLVTMVFRWVYLHKKNKWFRMYLSLENFNMGRESLLPPVNKRSSHNDAISTDGNNSTSPTLGGLRRSHSLPQVVLPNSSSGSNGEKTHTQRVSLLSIHHANTTDGELEHYFDSKDKLPTPANSIGGEKMNKNNGSVEDDNKELTKTPSAAETTIAQSSTTENQGVGFLVDGVPLIRYSRYASEFTEVIALGKGGFGTVFRCKNALDGREYAIKKVWIRYDASSPEQEFSQRLQRTLREVKSLALLDHPNIVRYYTAWLELGGGTEGEKGNDVSGFGESDYYGFGGKTSTQFGASSTGFNSNGRRPPSSFDGWSKTNTSTMSRKQTNYFGAKSSHNPLGWNAFDENASVDDDETYGQSFGQHVPYIPPALDDYGFTFDRSSTNSNSNTLGEKSESACKDGTSKEEQKECTDTKSKDETTMTKDGKISWAPRNQSFSNQGFFARSASFDSSVEGSISTWSRESRNTSFTKDTLEKKEATEESKKPTAIVKHTLYIQMQFCSQKTIADFLSNEQARKGPSGIGSGVDVPYALSLFLQIAQGVQHVHNQGLIHRDLKPNNCFIDDAGVVKVGDFGLSRESGDNKDSTAELISPGVFADGDNTAGVGTRSYASPEQMKGSDYDSSTDIYSLGVMLFELCYPMYTGMERHIVMSKLRNHIFPELWDEKVKVAFPSMHMLLLSMISNNPSDRPTADVVVRSIRSILDGFTITSLDKHHHETAILLRVEAKPIEGVLRQTIEQIKEAAAPTVVEIAQYGLKGGTNKAIMEFAVAVSDEEEIERSTLGNLLVDRMSACPDLLLIRQVSATKYT